MGFFAGEVFVVDAEHFGDAPNTVLARSVPIAVRVSPALIAVFANADSVGYVGVTQSGALLGARQSGG